MTEITLIEAAKAGDCKRAVDLIKQGADINQIDEQGWTPLNYAAGRGDLEMVKLLIENGAEIFRTGRDNRTPFMIALAAGRAATVQYLREVGDKSTQPKPLSSQRPYCKAYRLAELRTYPGWSEQRLNWTIKENDKSADGDRFPDTKVVFIHQDLSVTESMWHNENILFQSNDESWQQFCAGPLGFKAIDDIDLMVPDESLC